MAQVMSPIAGFSGLVQVGLNNPANVTLGFAKDQTITFNGEPLDVTNYQSAGWMEHIVGLRSWEASIEALYVDGDAGLTLIRQNALSPINTTYPSTLFYWAFYPLDTAAVAGDYTGTTYYTGRGVLSSFEISDPVDDAISISFSITGSGSLTTAVTA